MKANDLNGKEFGSLKVIRRIGSRWGHSLWECECECGVICERTANQLVWVTMTVQNRNKKKVKPCMKKSQNV